MAPGGGSDWHQNSVNRHLTAPPTWKILKQERDRPMVVASLQVWCDRRGIEPGGGVKDHTRSLPRL